MVPRRPAPLRHSAGPAAPFRRGSDRHQVDVWIVPLRAPSWRCGTLRRLLDAAEKGRAEALLLPSRRRQFVIAHCATRLVLGRYLDMDPGRIRFGRGEFGKPFVAGPNTPIRFSVSHSGELLLVAVGRAREVGIDVEAHRDRDYSRLLAKVLAGESDWSWLDRNGLRTDIDGARRWVELEAALKARGWGLARAPARSCRQPAAAVRGAKWRLHQLPLGGGYVAALCADVQVRKIVVFETTIDELHGLATDRVRDGTRLRARQGGRQPVPCTIE